MAIVDKRVDQIAVINQKLQEPVPFEVAAPLQDAKYRLQKALDIEFRELHKMSAPWAYMPVQLQSGCDQ